MEEEMENVSDDKSVMVGKYWRGRFKAHLVMDEFLISQLHQHTELSLHKTIYLFDHWTPRVDAVELK